MDFSISSSQTFSWPSSPPILASSSTNEIDEFSLFIPNISLTKNQYISIYCRENEVNDFIKRGFVFVYSINSTFSDNEEKRYYKMIKKSSN